jgi:tetratricopeptide (TPR) repeat protein
MRIGFAITAILSIGVLVLTNFPHVWLGLAITSIIAIAYYWYRSNVEAKVFSKIPIYFALLLILSTLFFFLGNSKTIGTFVQKTGLAESEVRLPWRYTIDVAAGALKDSPILGSGPNRFVNEYLKYKSSDISLTPFWNMEFPDGFGFLPTLLITTGVIGFFAWMLWGFSAMRRGVLVSRDIVSGSFDEYCLLVSGLPVVLFMIILVIYVPSHSMVFMFFVMAGLFVSASSIKNDSGNMPNSVSVMGKGLVVALGVFAILVLATTWVFYVRKVVASVYFQSGIAILSDGGDIENGRKHFESALSWHHADIYYQALSEINLIKISSIASNIKVTPDKDTIENIVNLINQAIDYTKRATVLDPYNYYNYVAEARALETATFLKMNGAKEKAIDSYRQAIVLNPKNPALYVSLARFEANVGQYDLAKQYIGEALKIKQNYTDAVFALVQIQVAEGKIDDAIISSQVATQISPNDPIAFFQLGLLHYNSKSYEKAVSAFEKAVSISPNYANASYFLGLSYARTGKVPGAVAVFEKLLKENPNNSEIALILSNLKSGVSPFSGAELPISQNPERRSSLPLKDAITETTESEN